MASPFAASSSINPQNTTSTRQVPGSKHTLVDLPALQNASHILLEQLSKDAQIIPDLGETLSACKPFPILTSVTWFIPFF
jgi:nuclear pore complex protein Nup155